MIGTQKSLPHNKLCMTGLLYIFKIARSYPTIGRESLFDPMALLNIVAQPLNDSAKQLKTVRVNNRFLISIGDYQENSVVLWSGYDGETKPVVLASSKTKSPNNHVCNIL